MKRLLVAGLILLILPHGCSYAPKVPKPVKDPIEDSVFKDDAMQDSLSSFCGNMSTHFSSTQSIYLYIVYAKTQTDTILRFTLANDVGFPLTKLYCVGAANIDGTETLLYCDSTLALPSWINASLFDSARADSLMQTTHACIFKQASAQYRIGSDHHLEPIAYEYL